MESAPRKKSPRAPSVALDVAIERALKIYKEENRHATPPDVVAQHLGYKGANNGSFVGTMATLGYYGLVERNKEGLYAVSKNVEAYQYAPDEAIRRKLLVDWLKTPAVFAGLLEKYGDRLPSDGNIKFDLIQRGFAPQAADACVNVFRRSVEYADYFAASAAATAPVGEQVRAEPETPAAEFDESKIANVDLVSVRPNEQSSVSRPVHAPSHDSTEGDRIPVRLAGGRRAWIEVPSPFYQADKKRLISQIELLLADDESEGESND
jgi:hypothetical protein